MAAELRGGGVKWYIADRRGALRVEDRFIAEVGASRSVVGSISTSELLVSLAETTITLTAQAGGRAGGQAGERASGRAGHDWASRQAGH